MNNVYKRREINKIIFPQYFKSTKLSTKMKNELWCDFYNVERN